MNTHGFVNTQAARSERALLARLREILSDIAWPYEFAAQQKGFDALVRLRTSAGKSPVLLVQCKTDLRPAAFQSWAQPRAAFAEKQHATPVLGLPFVSPRMVELCKATGWSWFDLSGNCRIEVPGVVHIERSGNPPRHHPPRPIANLSTPEAARVIRALLSTESGGRFASQRDLREQTVWPKAVSSDPEVSLGLVNKVVRHLSDEGFLVPDPDGGMRVQHPDRLLATWRDAYRFDRHERHALFTLLKGPGLREALNEVRSERMGDVLAYAAFSAAERQAPHVRQAKTWLFADAELLAPLMRRTEAKEADSGENLVVLVPEDSGVFAFRTGGDGDLPCTHPVQTYVDLWHCGARGEEAAQAVLEQKLKPVWDLREKVSKAGTA